jgi:hypothetical protein
MAKKAFAKGILDKVPQRIKILLRSMPNETHLAHSITLALTNK